MTEDVVTGTEVGWLKSAIHGGRTVFYFLLESIQLNHFRNFTILMLTIHLLPFVYFTSHGT